MNETSREIIVTMKNQPWPEPHGWFTIAMPRVSAQSIMENGWRFSKKPTIKVQQGMDWLSPGKEDRSWGFHLHTWEMMDAVLGEFATTRDEALLNWMLDIADDWAQFEKSDSTDGSMIWYDMSLSLRMARLARLMIYASHLGLDRRVEALLPAAERHIEEMFKPEAFNSGNNHGFYAAASSLDWARLLPQFPRSSELAALGEERLKDIASRQFAPDGGHQEHSPGYHRMLLKSFETGLNDGIIEDPTVQATVENATDVLGWWIQPDGYFVQFGDTDHQSADQMKLSSSNEQSQFIITNGHEGKPSSEELRVLPDAGYAMIRSPQPAGPDERINSSYLALQAAFHSRAHKHADDLTFVWFDRGVEILVDSGRFGYVDLLPADSPDRLKGFYYAAPERQYVESTVAHNTVSVNGEDIERRFRTPYGSALKSWSHENGIFRIEAEADCKTYTHHRVITLSPRQFLIVEDSLSGLAPGDEAIAWFNLNGEAQRVAGQDNELQFLLPGQAGYLTVEGDQEVVTPVRGQQEPLRGWRAKRERSFEPIWNLGFKLDASNPALRTEWKLSK
ncbi:alginate lyase family protein [Corynebacterium sp. Q4381]|uniref:heparinase II/III family protein n=1 Tax=Corynebacterium sp. Marseille-Q4381 TaxID=3121597 RepID=UPI002FE6AACA